MSIMLQAIDKFRAMQARTPVDRFLMPSGLSQEPFRHYARLFADQVPPAFR